NVRTTEHLSTDNPGHWDGTGPARSADFREHASAVMYQPGKILAVGGALFGGNFPATTLAEAIDLTAATPSWTPVHPMNLARFHHNATLLPDGTVLVTGGVTSGFEEYPDGVREAELLGPNLQNPSDDVSQWTWALLPKCPSYRGYHSVALLL